MINRSTGMAYGAYDNLLNRNNPIENETGYEHLLEEEEEEELEWWDGDEIAEEEALEMARDMAEEMRKEGTS